MKRHMHLIQENTPQVDSKKGRKSKISQFLSFFIQFVYIFHEFHRLQDSKSSKKFQNDKKRDKKSGNLVVFLTFFTRYQMGFLEKIAVSSQKKFTFKMPPNNSKLSKTSNFEVFHSLCTIF